MYLNSHSYYSLHFGTISEEELLQMAQNCGFSQMAITDINNTSAVLNFVRLAPKYSIRPIVGIDFRQGAKQLYVGIAKNNQGYLQLNKFLSAYLHNKEPLPEVAPKLENCYFIYPFEQLLLLDKYQFNSNEYIGVNTNDLRKLRFSSFIGKKSDW